MLEPGMPGLAGQVSAVFSECRTWRYTLTRDTGVRWRRPEGVATQWPARTVLFVCLNPSTADETKDDPTVRRCIRFARDWEFERLVVCNIFGLRSTDPKGLYDHPNPIGPLNGQHIVDEASRAEMVVIAWGNHGALMERGDRVRDLLQMAAKGKVHTLGFTSKGEPKHPLYLRADTEPVKLWT